MLDSAPFEPAALARVLRTLLRRGETLLQDKSLSRELFAEWQHTLLDVLSPAYGEHGVPVVNILGAKPIRTDEERAKGATNGESMAALQKLSATVRHLDLHLDLLEASLPVTTYAANQAVNGGHGVFVVHGRDEIRQRVARFIEQINLEATLIEERPRQGRTVIEQIERYSDVSFAVVLLTGDDRGGLASAEFEAQKLRARQNVIFELGYFVGRLGRARVCLLYTPGVEVPSDLHGILYTVLDDNGGWRLQLAQEMHSAGLPIDTSRLFRS